MADATPGWKLQLATAEAPPAPRARSGGDSQADRLVNLFSSLYRVGRTQDNDPFAVLRNGPTIALPLRGSGSLRAQLAAAYYATYETTPSASALADALNVVEGQALAMEKERVHIRAARHADSIVIDRGDADGNCIIVTSEGWANHQRSPVLFCRTETLGEMPEPKRGGSIKELREVLNVTDDTAPMLFGWLVSALIPDIARPVLVLTGEQGTGKSTAASMLVGLVDPSPVALRPPPRDEEQASITAAGSMVLCYDNVSSVSPWWSDLMCRMVYEAAYLARTHYTNKGTSVVSFRRAIILTGIALADLRGDLADRMLLIDLERIEATHRRGEAEILARFKARAPFILGAILDMLVDVLAFLPEVRLAKPSRMADFSCALSALDDARGLGALEPYIAQSGRVSDAVLDSDLFAEKLVAMMTGLRGTWQGTATELLLQLPKPNPLPKNWPATPQAIGNRLTRIAPALRDRGFEVEQLREAGSDRRRLWRIDPPAAMQATADDVFPVTAAASTPPPPPRQQQLAELTAETQTIERPPDAADEHGHEQEGDDV